MENPAAIARSVAFHFQGKKDGLYQKKGTDWVVRFTITSDDLNDSLKSSPLGTRYQIALVEVGDDELPVTGTTNISDLKADSSTCGDEDSDGGFTQAVNKSATKRKTTLPEYVGIFCNDEKFQKFISDIFKFGGGGEEGAKSCVRSYCGVKSRKEILPGTPAQKIWEDKFYNPYQEWLRR